LWSPSCVCDNYLGKIDVLLCVLEQLRVDNSSSGPNWEQFVQLAECWSCPFSVWFFLFLNVNLTKSHQSSRDNCHRHTMGFTIREPIGQIAPNWAPNWSYLLSAVQVHTTTHCRFYREHHCAPHVLRPVLRKSILLFQQK
jgi:hypothetical protein